MNKRQTIKLGCIADDFTGGSDAASFMSLGGLKPILCNGIPDESFEVPDDCDAIVIALKSRTQPRDEAVRDSLAAIEWLHQNGAEHYYFKYCSTFDSTSEGNIGPVADAILQKFNLESTVLCPALPINGRKVEKGLLYVNDVLLENSPMKDHPLTPMRESRIKDLMEKQSIYSCVEIFGDELSQNEWNISRPATDKYYIVPDYRDEEDAMAIVQHFGDKQFLTGGSGILKEWAKYLTDADVVINQFAGVDAPAILVAGSLSQATHSQTTWYENQGNPSILLSDEALLNGSQDAKSIWKQIAREQPKDILVYSYDTPEGLAKKRNEQGRQLSALIEKTLSETVVLAVQHGYTRVIVAGGETSGAVTQALGYQEFWIGESIAPGVPILVPVENTKIRLVLKSGNFGQEDFFGRALKMTGG